MSGNQLCHLAIIAGGALGPSGGGTGAVAEALALAGTIASEAFSLAPGLQVFSFVAPGIDRLLSNPEQAQPTLGACVDAAARLADTAAGSGAALRLCGRTEELPGELAALASFPAPAKSLLWFLRYGGRDEIARAAARYFRAHPGETLADDALDSWLDTAGAPDPDLIVLAGGVLEAQDALLWQGSYAELWHTPTPWARSSLPSTAATRANTERARFHPQHRLTNRPSFSMAPLPCAPAS